MDQLIRNQKKKSTTATIVDRTRCKKSAVSSQATQLTQSGHSLKSAASQLSPINCRYLLGVVDEEITPSNRHLSTWSTNKLGGQPDFMLPIISEDVRFPGCKICNIDLTLVVQIYAPLDDHGRGSSYHRTLYVFVCIPCYNSRSTSSSSKSDCWRVLRCQCLESPGRATIATTTSTQQPTINWLDSADDWGSPSNSNPSAMMDELDDDEDVELISNQQGVINEQLIIEDVDDQVEIELDEQGNALKESTSQLSLDDQHDDYFLSKLHVSDSMEGAVGLSYDFVEAQVEPLDDDDEATSVVTVDYTQCLPSRECIDTLFGPPSSLARSSENLNVIIKSFFLGVIDESELLVIDQAGDRRAMNLMFGEHERELLAAYQRHEGIMNINEIYNRSQKLESSGGELYEKCAVKHGDREFEKMQNRLRLCPEQLLRYCRDPSAVPLSIGALKSGGVELELFKTGTNTFKCPNCGGDSVFELQILPTAVDFMRVDNLQDPVLEFGTILIFTCRTSCWSSSLDSEVSKRRFVDETIVVISDPDEILFAALKRKPPLE